MTRSIRYAISGLGRRCWTTYLPIFSCKGRGRELAAVVDSDPGKLSEFSARWPAGTASYQADAFNKMLREVMPDRIILTAPDYAHHSQIIAALNDGVSVITEKPMVINAFQARDVVAAAARSSGQFRIANNLRFQNLSVHIKALLNERRIGRVTNIEFAYHLTTGHAGNYFRRWHRRRAASGGLSVTKSCHHFDLLNWWLNDVPMEVSGWIAGRHFVPGAPFPDDTSRTVPLDADIEDTIGAQIRYRDGGQVSYTLTSCSPWEGYTMKIRGTKGQLIAKYDKLSTEDHKISLRVARELECHFRIPREQGRHAGADKRMTDLLFGEHGADELDCLPGAYEGALAVAIGDAVNLADQRGSSVAMSELLPAAAVAGHWRVPEDDSRILSPGARAEI